jgi:hypothetical protein
MKANPFRAADPTISQSQRSKRTPAADVASIGISEADSLKEIQKLKIGAAQFHMNLPPMRALFMRMGSRGGTETRRLQ